MVKGTKFCSLLHVKQNRLLGDVEDQIQQVLTLTFENYKSLDESESSGVMDVFVPATGLAAPALGPAVKLFGLLHDVLLPEVQLKFSRYFQVPNTFLNNNIYLHTFFNIHAKNK